MGIAMTLEDSFGGATSRQRRLRSLPGVGIEPRMDASGRRVVEVNCLFAKLFAVLETVFLVRVQ